MTRRELFRSGAIGAGALALALRRGLGQTPARPSPDSTVADPLARPDLVQDRAAATAADNDPVIKELEHRFRCTCGCNLDVYTCRTTDFTCTYSPALHREVLALRREGKSPDQVEAAFVAKYGERILMAPEPQGFNLAGYLLPGALVATAGVLLAAVLLRRSRRPPQPAAAPAQSAASPSDAERLARALRDVED